jgi:uncharacterized membrane protein YebE (DUF533 family)
MAQGFDARRMLEALLAGGSEIAQRGDEAVGRAFGTGEGTPEREALRKGALGGAVGAAALSLLLGTRTGRKLGRTGLALGGLAALGRFAFDRWQGMAGEPAAAAAPVDDLSGPDADARARVLIAGMIAAAKADGTVDAAEREAILARLEPLSSDATAFLFEELARPVDAAAVAALAPDPQTKAELYSVSVMVCGEAGPAERHYLERLATALGLSVEGAQGIEDALRDRA